MDFGLEEAGFLVRLQVEKDRRCLETLAANSKGFRSRGRVVLGDDIRNLSPGDVLRAGHLRHGEIALLAGGPPCQSFSYAGARRGLGDPRGLLVSHFVRMLKGLQPETFLFENVAGFADVPVITPRGIEPLATWFVKRCVQAGYVVSWGVLDAADYGAPQHRVRFVALGCKHGCVPSLPAPTHGPRGSGRYVPIRAALTNLDERSSGLGGFLFRPRMHEILAQVPVGGDWRDLPEGVKAAAMGQALEDRGGKTGFWRRMSWDRPSPTIVSRPDHRGTCLCHPRVLRPLTVRECARIQGFPDSWVFQGSIGARYRQVGDAVPVALGCALGKVLVAHLSREQWATIDGWPVNLVALGHGPSKRRLGVWGWASPKGTTRVYAPRPRRSHPPIRELAASWA